MDINLRTLEQDYRCGKESLRSLAARHGTSEGSIRRWAKKYDWERDNTAPKPPKAVPTLEVVSLAANDIKDMGIGLDNARRALTLIQEALALFGNDPAAIETLKDNARNLRLLVDTNRHAIDTIRRIRGLDTSSGLDKEELAEGDKTVIERYVSKSAVH